MFLFAAIWSHLVQSWSGLKYMSKAKYKRFENREIHYNYFSITATSSFFKRPDFRACFIFLACCMHLNKSETEGVIKSLVFLFAAIWSHLVQSWSGLKYMSKAKYKRFENREIHYNYFSITATSSFFKRPDFRACFIFLACCMHLNKSETERVIKSPVFLFAAIWSHLVQSWSGLKYMSKAKCKRFENREIHCNYFSITATSSFFKRSDFRACFIFLACCMHLNKFSRKYINIV